MRTLEKAPAKEVIDVDAASENAVHTLGARAPIISGDMLNTLRIQSISDHNVSSGQKSDTFKMCPVM